MPKNETSQTAARVSFATQIAPLFDSHDVACMTPQGVLLTDYTWMSTPANAQNVYAHLTGQAPPQMPLGGPYWSQANLDLFQQWMSSGYNP